MRHALLIALVGLLLIPVPASAERLGRRLDAIQSGRLYDPVLTPQMNPSFQFQPNAEERFLYDLRKGRVNIDRIPEAQRDYFQMRLNSTK
ncbi:hypothetical protein LL06_21660 [Hoeflea sp. BAL378]|uniref:hypothetical protein n=1 Tax=Hoeflea sp. BAL378 TaxID=1547437 RepID=UPI0005146432|nr:hypothetical protein [Hoeflea sp. BAL378]KGF67552.1 hypothetical protein LL06_21660 [Hoeflea sp. BAL378]